MAYTARKLITKAYYTSAYASRRLNTLSGQEASDGLELLNDLIADKTAEVGLIPFYKQKDFIAITDQVSPGVYFVEGAVEIDSLTFANGLLRYPCQRMSRSEFYAHGHMGGMYGYPGGWFAERVENGMNVYFYTLPSDTFTISIIGKFGLEQIFSLNTDLLLYYERGYINYLQFKLAELICAVNGLTFEDDAKAILMRYERSLNYISPIDLTPKRKMSSLSSCSGGIRPYYNWFPGGMT